MDDPIPEEPATSDRRPPVALLGTGALGTAVGRALLAKGHPTTVWNRTPERAEPLVAAGATAAATIESAVAAAELVIVCVPTADDVRTVLESAVGALPDRAVVNLTSGTPEEARSLAAWLAPAGADLLDAAAMSGTRLVGHPEAVFLVSGERRALAAAEPVLHSLGRHIDLGADPGMASLHDVALFGVNMALLSGFHHAAALVRTEGVDPARFGAVVADYLSFATGLVAEHGHQIAAGRYPGDDGTLTVLAAAIGHLVRTSEDRGVSADLPRAVAALVARAVAAGHGDDGAAGLIEAMAPEAA